MQPHYRKDPLSVTVFPDKEHGGYLVAMPDGTPIPRATKIVIIDDYVGQNALVEITLRANFADQAYDKETAPETYLAEVKRLKDQAVSLKNQKEALFTRLNFVENELEYARDWNKVHRERSDKLSEITNKWWYKLFKNL